MGNLLLLLNKEAFSGGGRSDYGAAIRSVWLCTPVPPALLAEIVREWLPASVGLPLMRPVVALMVRPDGRLVVA